MEYSGIKKGALVLFILILIVGAILFYLYNRDRCSNLTDNALRESCYIERAAEKEDSQICENIEDNSRRADCIENVQITGEAVLDCGLINDPGYLAAYCKDA